MATQKYNQFISNIPNGLISRWCQNVPNTGTSSTSGPQKPAKSSCKKQTNKQMDKQGPLRWLSCLPVAEHPRSDHFPGGQETWVQPHPQTEVSLPQQGPPTSSGAFVPCEKQGERRIQPRCPSGTAQEGWQTHARLWSWLKCHNGSRAELAPS